VPADQNQEPFHQPEDSFPPGYAAGDEHQGDKWDQIIEYVFGCWEIRQVETGAFYQKQGESIVQKDQIAVFSFPVPESEQRDGD